MIDLGRKKDMEILMLMVNDQGSHITKRRQAYRTMQSIKRKMNDPTITKLRLRLIAASLNNDVDESDKLSERIQDYERKHYIARKF